MPIAILLAAGLAWWLHRRGELLPNLLRFGGAGLAALLALRLLEDGQPLIALALAGGGAWWWWSRRPRLAPPVNEAQALSILGLPRGASAEEIQAAWRRAIATAHPDAGGSTEAVQRVTAARDLLLGARRLWQT